MADLKKRITSLTEKTTLTSGDFAAVDNTSGGTKKYNLYQLTQDMAGKADADGSYEGMTAGNAEQLLSDVYTEDKEPYKYRASFSGDREVDEIVGGTVAWNQLAKELTSANYTAASATATYSNGEVTLTNTGYNGRIYQAVTMAANHKYLLSAESINTDSIPAYCYADALDYYSTGFALPQSSAYVRTAKVINSAGRTPAYILIRNNSNAGTVKVKNLMLIDLTQMFGSTIADYILAQEQATAGAGVAIFRKLFPASYYAYNAGELISVSGLSAHETTSKNLICGKVANANIDGTGTIISSSTYNLYYAEVKAGFTYTITTTGGQFVGGFFTSVPTMGSTSYDGTRVVNNNRTFTAPIDGYALFRAEASFETPQLEIGSVVTAYSSEYWKHSYPLDSSLTLRGIPKLADGKMYFDGDTYASDGTVTRRFGIVDLGSLTWTYLNDGIFRAPKVADMLALYSPNWICGKYQIGITRNYAGWKTVDKRIGFLEGYQFIICMDTSYTDAATFKTAMNGVYLVYELATATTETAEPFTNPQIVSEYGTEEYVSATICPVGHNTKYPENLRKKIEGLPWDLSMIAPIENGTTASKAYSVGQYFLHNNVFCKAKTSIASGATFTLNTNYTETTVAAELYSALH